MVPLKHVSVRYNGTTIFYRYPFLSENNVILKYWTAIVTTAMKFIWMFFHVCAQIIVVCHESFFYKYKSISGRSGANPIHALKRPNWFHIPRWFVTSNLALTTTFEIDCSNTLSSICNLFNLFLQQNLYYSIDFRPFCYLVSVHMGSKWSPIQL